MPNRSTIEQLEAEKERLRARRAGKGLSVNGILGGNGTPGGFLGAPKPPSAARMLRESAAEAAAAAVMTVRWKKMQIRSSHEEVAGLLSH